jgi:hypothetical protein
MANRKSPLAKLRPKPSERKRAQRAAAGRDKSKSLHRQEVEPQGSREEYDSFRRGVEQTRATNRTRQHLLERIAEKQRRKRRWINFAEIAEWCSELGGHVVPNEAARENALKWLERDLLEGFFEKNSRSLVVLLSPGVCKRMTLQWLQDAINYDWDDEHGRSYLKNCWFPRKLFILWCARHHLPQSAPRFEPQESRVQPPNRGGRPPGADWDELQDRLAQRIKLLGYPNRQNTPGWRRTKDVVDWLIEDFGNELENVEYRTIEDNVRRMLRALKSSAKPVSR